MKLKRINESFKVLAENALAESASREELKVALMDEVYRLMSKGAMIKEFEIAFQDVIERFYPDKSWWEVCSLNIFWDLMESLDPEETVQHIIDNMKEEPAEETITEEMDTFYGSLCKEMDNDNEKMYHMYTEDNMSPASALMSLGYQEVDTHYLVKTITQDGIEYNMIFDFSDYDYGDSDSYEYYVLKDGVIPKGWTSTFSAVDESVTSRIEDHVNKLDEAEKSDDYHAPQAAASQRRIDKLLKKNEDIDNSYAVNKRAQFLRKQAQKG